MSLIITCAVTYCLWRVERVHFEHWRDGRFFVCTPFQLVPKVVLLPRRPKCKTVSVLSSRNHRAHWFLPRLPLCNSFVIPKRQPLHFWRRLATSLYFPSKPFRFVSSHLRIVCNVSICSLRLQAGWGGLCTRIPFQRSLAKSRLFRPCLAFPWRCCHQLQERAVFGIHREDRYGRCSEDHWWDSGQMTRFWRGMSCCSSDRLFGS